MKFRYGFQGDGSDPMFRPMYGEERIISPVLYLVSWICIVLVLFAVVVGFLAPPVSAQNMTITDLGIVGVQTVQIYGNNGTLLGTYNTTTNGISLPATDFVMLVKPDTTSIFADPLALLTEGFQYIQANVIPIVIILFFIGLVIRR
jgi:hypothetical protein